MFQHIKDVQFNAEVSKPYPKFTASTDANSNEELVDDRSLTIKDFVQSDLFSVQEPEDIEWEELEEQKDKDWDEGQNVYSDTFNKLFS